MKRIAHSTLAIVAGLTVTVSPLMVDANTLDPIVTSEGVTSGNLAQCFDYYEFGSVGVDVTQDLDQYSPGDPVLLNGSITNNNNYPLVGVDVYARVIKDIPNPNLQAETMTIDEFTLVEDITLDAGASYQFDEAYTLSTIAPAGEYQVLFYVAQQDRFNLSGLSFTDDVFASRVTFTVTGDNGPGVYLDQTATRINDQEHQNIGFLTEHSASEDITVNIPLRNTQSEEVEVQVKYSLYSWDGLQESNLVRYFEENVTLAANGTQELTQTVSNAQLPVYYLKVEAIPVDQNQAAWERSISNIRFSVPDKVKSRLNFVGLSSYKSGTSAELVTCFHNTNSGVDPEVTVKTELLNRSGNVLAMSEYRGDVGPDIAAVSSPVDVSTMTNTMVVKSTITNSNGEVVDQVNFEYDCQEINPSLCESESILSGASNSRTLLAVLSVALIGFLVGAAVYLQRAK